MTSKAAQRDRTHRQILDSAAHLLRTQGIAGASVASVMERAGLTVGGFYAHFASKAQLIDETLRRTSADLRKHLFAGLVDKPAADRAVVVLKRYLSAAHRDKTTMGCPFPSVVGEIGTTAPEYRDACAEQVDAVAVGLEQQLPPGRTTSPRTIALGLVALMYGGLSLACAVRGAPLSDEILRACRALGTAAVRSELGA